MARALLVVDMDYYYGWTNEEIEKNKDKKNVSEAIGNLLTKERGDKGIVVFVTFPNDKEFPGKESQIKCDEHGQGKCLVCDRQHRLAEFLMHGHGTLFEAAFTKSSIDAFTNSKITGYLRSKGVTEILLAGCQTFKCLLETARGALKKGFNVTLLSDCVYPPFSSKGIEKIWLKRLEHVIRPNHSLSAKIT